MTSKPSNVLAGILDNNRLTGPNFSDLLRNLKIVLNLKRIGYILESKVPGPLPKGASQEEHDTFAKWKEDDIVSKCYMLASMTNEL